MHEHGKAVPEVRAFWTGAPLSPYEELSLRSFVVAGARVVLYSTMKGISPPSGVEVADVKEILSGDVQHFVFPDGDQSPALHSDLFRYAALQKFGGWYSDLDIVCLGKKMPSDKVYLASESDASVNGAIMRFPARSSFVTAAIDDAQRRMPDVRPGAPVSARGYIGPALVTTLVHRYALDHILKPRSSAYAISPAEIPAMFDPRRRDELDERVANSDFVHLWHEYWRRVRIPKNIAPPAGSFLDGLFERFEIRFAGDARLSPEAVAAWFEEAWFLSSVRSHLKTPFVASDSLNRLLGRDLQTVHTSSKQTVPSPEPNRGGDPIRTFWSGGSIGPYHLLCLRSFVDRGYQVEVYTFDKDLDLPPWLHACDGREIVPRQKIVQELSGSGQVAIYANLFRYALLQQKGGWWIDPDVILLGDELPQGTTFAAGPSEFNSVCTSAIKFDRGDPVLTDALLRTEQWSSSIDDWDKTGEPLLTQCIAEIGLKTPLATIEQVSPLSWFSVEDLFNPQQAGGLEERFSGAAFLDLHMDAWLRAGVPRNIGPPQGSYLDRLFEKHPLGSHFAARMEFHDVRRWLVHMYGNLQR